jgi:hypothetical protein
MRIPLDLHFYLSIYIFIYLFTFLARSAPSPLPDPRRPTCPLVANAAIVTTRRSVSSGTHPEPRELSKLEGPIDPRTHRLRPTDRETT